MQFEAITERTLEDGTVVQENLTTWWDGARVFHSPAARSGPQTWGIEVPRPSRPNEPDYYWFQWPHEQRPRLEEAVAAAVAQRESTIASIVARAKGSAYEPPASFDWVKHL